ncbi:MAG TPA: hypothetical protein DEA75_18850 [Rhodobacteraceae bacterium]|nr:hypothetical protein [Paracoccaceae bacterium]
MVFVTRHVKLNAKVCLFYLGLFLAGVGFILGSVFISQYGGAWTFLFPLPTISGGAWELGVAVAFCVGYLLLWVGFLIY